MLETKPMAALTPHPAFLGQGHFACAK